MKHLATAVLVLLTVLNIAAASQRAPQNSVTTAGHSAEYLSMERKVEKLKHNAEQSQPDSAPTQLTTAEINAYMNEGGINLPTGVQGVRFSSKPAVITAASRIDFDALTAGRSSMNPLLSVFTGVHDVIVVAQATGAGGEGSVRVESMSIDGLEVPRAAMQFFVDRYLKPRYPRVGLDSRFRLPLRIDTAIIGTGSVSLTQR
ncbi:MAG TPA: hypothetical protein VN622_08690 [Clostridia bacterium]|nr:hypothetical protein [Clostridia bacterium]